MSCARLTIRLLAAVKGRRLPTRLEPYVAFQRVGPAGVDIVDAGEGRPVAQGSQRSVTEVDLPVAVATSGG